MYFLIKKLKWGKYFYYDNYLLIFCFIYLLNILYFL